MDKKRIRKRLAGLLAFALIGLLLLFVNSFLGNPVSAALAKRAAQDYAAQHYPELGLAVQSSGYNFKFGHYSVFLQSPTSQDTAFSVGVDSFGQVVRDDYPHEVENNFTTFRRLDQELRDYARERLAPALALDVEYIGLGFTKELELAELELDMELDPRHPPQPLEISLVAYSDTLTYGEIARMAKALETVILAQGVLVEEYSVRLIPTQNRPQREGQAASWVGDIAVDYFPGGLLGEEDLPQVMERYQRDRNTLLDREKEQEIGMT